MYFPVHPKTEEANEKDEEQEQERKRKIATSFYRRIDENEEVARVFREFPEESNKYCKDNGFYVVPYESLTGDDAFDKGDYGITHCMFLAPLPPLILGDYPFPLVIAPKDGSEK